MRILILVSMAVVSLGGCALFAPRLQAPTVEVRDVQLLGGDFQHQRLRVRLSVDNPNARRLDVRTVTYQLALAGTPLASGQGVTPFTIPASGRGEFDLDVETDFALALRIVSEHLRAGSVDYVLAGRVKLDSGWIPELPFTGRGQLSLP